MWTRDRTEVSNGRTDSCRCRYRNRHRTRACKTCRSFYCTSSPWKPFGVQRKKKEMQTGEGKKMTRKIYKRKIARMKQFDSCRPAPNAKIKCTRFNWLIKMYLNCEKLFLCREKQMAQNAEHESQRNQSRVIEITANKIQHFYSIFVPHYDFNSFQFHRDTY